MCAMAGPKPQGNISPEIEAAFAEGREAGLREAARYVRSLKEVFVPWVLRGLNGVPETGPDGWGKMMQSQETLRDGIARGVDRLVNGEPRPEHECMWAEGKNSCCPICGKDKPVE